MTVTMQSIREAIMDIQSELVMVNAKVVSGTSSPFTFVNTASNMKNLMCMMGPCKSSDYVAKAIEELNESYQECAANDGEITENFSIYIDICVGNLRAAYINLGK